MSMLDARARELQPSAVMAALRAVAPLVVSVGIALLLQFVVRPQIGDYNAKILLDICTNIILAVSLTLVNGFTGQFSIGHAAFMAIGAYSAACVTYYGSHRIYGDANVHGGLISTMVTGRDVAFIAGGDALFFAAMIVGGLVAAFFGYIVGLPSLRIRGDYLAIVTLGFGEIVRVLLQQTEDTLYRTKEIMETPIWAYPMHVGGGLGFIGLPFYSNLFWGGLMAALTLVVAFRLKVSSPGRALLSIREDEIAAETVGIHITRYKVRAFVIAAFFGGIAGALFAHTNGVQLNPSELGFIKSFDIIIMVVLGGLGSISGATIAATLLTIAPELLRDPPSAWPWGFVVALMGAAVIAVLVRQRYKPFLMVALFLGGWELLRGVAMLTGIELSDYRMVIYALMLVCIMILRPSGLLGLREVWDLFPTRSHPSPKQQP